VKPLERFVQGRTRRIPRD